MKTQITNENVNNDFNTQQNQFKNVVSIFKTVSRSFPKKLALISENRSLSYEELDRRSDELAGHLIALQLKSGTSIAVCMPQSVERIISFLAVLKIGAAYLPIDGQLPENRIKMMIEDAQAELVITENTYIEKFSDTVPGLINIDEWKTKPIELDMEIINPEDISPMQTAYIIYTSGSTGLPKGVEIHHEAFSTFVQAFTELWGFSSKDVTLQFSSIGFDVSIIDIWIPLLTGATIVLYPDNKIIGKPLLDFIIDHKIDTVPYLPPAVLSTLPTDLPIGSLHTLSVAGEAPSEQTVKSWCNRVRLINVYGPTETTVSVVTHQFKIEDTNPHIIGQPLESAQIYILDKNLEKVHKGITGEIYIGGKQLAKGYINRPLETAEAFIEAPEWIKFIHGEEYRLYKSGDRAFWREDGNIEFVGRLDDQVKLRGFRIELKEIEHHIGQLAQVANAAVKVHRPEQGLPILVAFLELYDADKEYVTLEDVRGRLKQSLPTYMLPDKIVLYDKLPLTLTGKIDKSKLHIPLQQVSKKAKEKVNASDLKQEMTEIWTDLLNLDEIDENDNFFELGGHSLMLAQMHDRLPLNVRKKVSLPELYRFPTINLFVEEAQNRLAKNEATQQQKARLVEEQLLKDSELPFDFEIKEQPDPRVLGNPSKIFLTGVTGFVGSHLLEELIFKNPNATIYCLVRAENEKLGLERIKSTFLKFKLVWIAEYEDKIKIILGDLTKPNLGVEENIYRELAKDMQVIYHMGSDVSYVQPYEHIKKPNVDGMANILHLAVNDKTKFLIISSSMGVYSWGRSFTGKTWMTEDEPIEQNLPAVCRDMGYIRSKWVMESMASKARDKGLPLINFRLGFVVCHGETGATPLNQWWSSLMRSCIELKAFPYVMGLKDEVITVDYVCKAIAHISQKKDAVGLNFNLNPLPEHDLSLTDFCVRITDYCGLQMKGMDFQNWFEQWRRNQELPLYSLLYLFTDDVHEGKSLVEAYEDTYYFKSNNTERFLKDTDIRPAIFNKKVMEAYLRFMKMI
ncbi:amino acid adenylation domain-containing protein [Chryseobacterium sp. WG14]|uniref:non-ribosomal peptide synthetase n=1 Tax=unclassified Chryseobacterium TaxID=2593645 RepID=UPI00211ED490|nr:MULTISPECIES: non-ribosomal peptide synthetase [unclassified Chryseobacterium]MCQ9635665.1 amino acid adenylation domain-containing protein [Chryseobacterium sp. WG23]MCQ9637944.1 amino acid adenylation domain-containing protein [Chryseobacterium sp. WG14]